MALVVAVGMVVLAALEHLVKVMQEAPLVAAITGRVVPVVVLVGLVTLPEILLLAAQVYLLQSLALLLHTQRAAQEIDILDIQTTQTAHLTLEPGLLVLVTVDQVLL